MLSVATWNINSARLRVGLIEKLLTEAAPDILCLQEIKCESHLFPAEALAALGYTHQAVSGQKGYHGVATVSRVPIREVARQAAPSLLKLRLMENEENLFDSGLYVGIGGTAAALVLQVLGLIEPNLLAAYSSNLFGITCVALVKIRHVRPYKRQLIIASQVELQPTGK
jgi:hypothetical protein